MREACTLFLKANCDSSGCGLLLGTPDNTSLTYASPSLFDPIYGILAIAFFVVNYVLRRINAPAVGRNAPYLVENPGPNTP